MMSYLLCIICMISYFIAKDPAMLIAAGLFSIAGEIVYHKKKEEKTNEKT